MTRAQGLILAALVSGACARAPRPDPDASAPALAALATPDAGPSLAEAPGDAGEADGVGAGGPEVFTFEPPELMVYRSTAVRFRAAPPAAHPEAQCTWSFGDGSPPADGCEVEHTFHGGTADQRVTLTLVDGAWRFEGSRIVPLERLPVSPGIREPSEPGAIPSKPEAGPTSFRAVLLADLVGGSADELSVVAQTITGLAADVVIVVGGAALPDEAAPWETVRTRLVEPLVAAEVPVLWAMSPTDLEAGAEVRRPAIGPSSEALELADGAGFPGRWTLAYKGVYLVFVSGATLTDDALDWMRQRLSEAQIYESRVVVSYLPLHPFSEGGPAERQTIGPKFKVYELLLRARTTALISAGHRAYFKGRYGALPVVSVGAATGKGERLSGHDFEQAASLVVMDVEGGVPTRIFALEAPGYETVLDEGYLPDTVEVYTR
ncbi:MAG: hypothetical protein IT385_02530 [Deltaproteobacteria bacterium]|nr:hypothetical protein [Deltaproteobacteria bacterium]